METYKDNSIWIRPLYADAYIKAYKLYPWASEKTEMQNRDIIMSFLAIGYTIDEDTGERKRCEHDAVRYISLQALMSNYILEGSSLDTHVKMLEEFRNDVFKKNSEESISVLTDAIAYIQQTENEEDREDICALHSEQPENNETTAA